MRLSAGHRRGALTLLEVVVAIVLITMLMGAMVTFFWQVLQVRDATAETADRMQVARQVLDKIARELRGCIGFDEFNFPIEQPIVEDEFLDALDEGEQTEVEAGMVPLLVGTRRTIQFLTTALPDKYQYDFFQESDYLPPARHDIRQISYWLWLDEEEIDEDGNPMVGGIVRTEKKTLNQFIIDLEDPLDVRNDLWSHELGYIEFRYFDGVEWTTQWNVTEGNALPQLIQVTVGFKPITSDEIEDRDLDEFPIEEYPYGDIYEHTDRYSIIVRMPAADNLFRSRIKRLGQEMSEQLGVEGL